MSEDLLWGVIAAGNLGTVVTIKKDGRPQLSDVSYHAAGRLIRSSTRTLPFAGAVIRSGCDQTPQFDLTATAGRQPDRLVSLACH